MCKAGARPISWTLDGRETSPEPRNIIASVTTLLHEPKEMTATASSVCYFHVVEGGMKYRDLIGTFDDWLSEKKFTLSTYQDKKLSNIIL